MVGPTHPKSCHALKRRCSWFSELRISFTEHAFPHGPLLLLLSLYEKREVCQKGVNDLSSE